MNVNAPSNINAAPGVATTGFYAALRPQFAGSTIIRTLAKATQNQTGATTWAR